MAKSTASLMETLRSTPETYFISAAANPAKSGRLLRARVFWLHPRPLAVGGEIIARIGTAWSPGVVRGIENAVDPGLLASDGAEVIGQNHVGEIEIEVSSPLAIDPYTADPNTGRIVLELNGRIAGGGLVLSVETSDADAAFGQGSAGKAAPVKTAPNEIAPRPDSIADELVAKAAALSRQFADLSPAERIARLRR